LIDLKIQDWRKPFHDAIAETDARRLPQVIAEAENIIFIRWKTLDGTPNERSERVAIHNALNELRALKSPKRKSAAK
jgi:hypothetical protein